MLLGRGHFVGIGPRPRGLWLRHWERWLGEITAGRNVDCRKYKKLAAPLTVAAGVSSLLDDVQIAPVGGKRGVWVRGRSKPLVASRVFAKRG